MGKRIVLSFVFAFVLFFSIQTSFGQDSYANLTPIYPNPQWMPYAGWTLVFQDEFNGVKKSMWKNYYNHGNAFNGAPGYNFDYNYLFSSDNKAVILKTTPEPSGCIITGGWPDYPYKYVTKYFSSAILNSQSNVKEIIQIPDHQWLYGYFEIRCRNPKSQSMWPAFWLYGEPNPSGSQWNEIDVFELGAGDNIVLTNHYQPIGGNHGYSNRWIYSLPGQLFGDTWVTYAVKWEPNKIIWYINNVPVFQVTENVPQVAMWVMICSGMDYLPFDLNLPPLFPNNMEIDYIRIYQRNNYSLPDPIFTINRQTSNFPFPIRITFSQGDPIYLDGSQSYMPNQAYFLSVQKCDQNGNPIPGSLEAMGWLSSSEVENIGNFNITAFAQSKGLTLNGSNRYRVKLAGGLPWKEVNQVISLANQPINVDFKINGQSASTGIINIPYNYGKHRIILDGSATVPTNVNNAYKVSLQECNSGGTGFGTIIFKWLTPDEIKNINQFDVENFADLNSFILNYGNYYKITLTTGTTSPQATKSQIVRITPCTDVISFKINGQNNVFPSPIHISGGQEIILDGSLSTFCSNQYFISIQKCNSAGQGTGTELIRWYNYFKECPNYNKYFYGIGRFNIRDTCKKENFILECGSYYKIKLATGNPWVEDIKIIKIDDCSNVNNQFDIYGDPGDASGSVITTGIFNNTNVKIYLYSHDGLSCNNSYFLSVRQKVNGVLVGPEAMAWLSPNEIYQLKTLGIFDLGNFANNHGVTFTNGSTYNVKLVADAGGCNPYTWLENNKIITFNIVPPLSQKIGTTIEESIIEDFEEIEMKVFPNPSYDKIYVSFPKSENKVKLNLMNLQGDILKVLQSDNDFAVFDVYDLPSGTYLLQAFCLNKTLTKKVQLIK